MFPSLLIIKMILDLMRLRLIRTGYKNLATTPEVGIDLSKQWLEPSITLA